MGSASRIRPDYLAQKLLTIRTNLGLSQTELAEELSFSNFHLRKSDISRYESGVREPSLIVLLKYARLGNVTMEMLVDDDIELPT
jgi:transcriptional regulator with XRE-family HTH domain